MRKGLAALRKLVGADVRSCEINCVCSSLFPFDHEDVCHISAAFCPGSILGRVQLQTSVLTLGFRICPGARHEAQTHLNSEMLK